MSLSRRDVAGTIGAAVAVGLVLRPREAAADCPNIEKAISALNAAQGNLRRATHDFGGHRADALNAVNDAASRLGKCLQAQQCK